MNTHNIVMWVILPNNADWDCFKTLTLQEILRIQNLHQVEHCALSKATHRNKSEVIDEARTNGKKVFFASLMDICHLKNAELETKHQ